MAQAHIDLSFLGSADPPPNPIARESVTHRIPLSSFEQNWSIRRVYSKKVKKGRVISQKPTPGTRLVNSREQEPYLTSVSILNIGRYIEMMITPTIRPTPIIMIGSMIEVSVWIDESTSSS